MQGVTLQVEPGQIVALLGTNGAGKTTTLRAISGFLGIDDARVTEGTITFKGERIENRPPHEITRRGIVLVPERDKVFPEPHGGREPRRAGRAAHVSAAERRRREALVYEFFPRSPICAAASAACSRAASGRCSRSRARSCAGPRCCWSTSFRSASRRWWSRTSCARLVEIRRELGISILLVEQNAAVALEIADYGYVHGERPGRARRRRARGCAATRTSRSSISARPAARTPQLSRRQAISPQPEVVWLSSRSTA